MTVTWASPGLQKGSATKGAQLSAYIGRRKLQVKPSRPPFPQKPGATLLTCLHVDLLHPIEISQGPRPASARAAQEEKRHGTPNQTGLATPEANTWWHLPMPDVFQLRLSSRFLAFFADGSQKLYGIQRDQHMLAKQVSSCKWSYLQPTYSKYIR